MRTQNRGWVAAAAVATMMVVHGQAEAAGVVGTGSPASCTEAAFVAALSGGGLVTFDCGGPATITLTSRKLVVADTTIDGNDEITLSGGGTTRLFGSASSPVFTLRNLTISGGYTNAFGAARGGAIWMQGGSLVVEHCTFSDNVAELNGGNFASPLGGAIACDSGPLVIRDSLFVNNVSRVMESTSGFANGGAIASFVSVEVTRTRFENNRAIATYTGPQAHNVLAQGGVFWMAPGIPGATAEFADCTFVGNSAEVTNDPGVAHGRGGALYLDGGDLRVLRSTFEGNSAVGSDRAHGGAVFAGSGTDAVVASSTFVGNQATTEDGDALGGAIALGAVFSGSSTLSIFNSTIVGNTATGGASAAAVSTAGVAVSLRNSILEDNTPANCSAGIAADSTDVEFPASSCAGAFLGDPLLDPAGLADNGGSTETIAILEGSPASRRGDAATCAGDDVESVDQRGTDRFPGSDPYCDSGAFEYNAVPPPLCPSTPSTCVDAPASSLKISGAGTAKGKFSWKWSKGAMEASQLGDPSTSTSYSVCVYDDGDLAFEISAEASGTCGSKPCWKALGTKGFGYKSKTNFHGLKLLKASASKGNGSIVAVGKGPALPLALPLAQSASVQVQLVKDPGSGPECWGSTYLPPSKESTDSRFSDAVK